MGLVIQETSTGAVLPVAAFNMSDLLRSISVVLLFSPTGTATLWQTAAPFWQVTVHLLQAAAAIGALLLVSRDSISWRVLFLHSSCQAKDLL